MLLSMLALAALVFALGMVSVVFMFSSISSLSEVVVSLPCYLMPWIVLVPGHCRAEPIAEDDPGDNCAFAALEELR